MKKTKKEFYKTNSEEGYIVNSVNSNYNSGYNFSCCSNTYNIK